jgi:hypothetical protein
LLLSEVFILRIFGRKREIFRTTYFGDVVFVLRTFGEEEDPGHYPP